MDFSLKFPAGIRKQTLRSLGRGYDKISAKQSEIAFKDCSEVEKMVYSKIWGSNDTLSCLGTMLQRGIFVICPAMSTGTMGEIHYAPETRSHLNKSLLLVANILCLWEHVYKR
ncbi:hypothetical protein PsorP6_006184 [Peronosclerospora sorghi]|uniref:Uncharacterized protein n=1 Tax=Peronosclerospora sorghi TaxID=230839 RepID=A0ACC0W3I0_9STRA|nr:hypothetical protein PsorP6_006184 [Peronosclerospora sorghi]